MCRRLNAIGVGCLGKVAAGSYYVCISVMSMSSRKPPMLTLQECKSVEN